MSILELEYNVSLVSVDYNVHIDSQTLPKSPKCRFSPKCQSIQNCYVFTLLEMVCHLEGGQGDNCEHYMARYCNVLTFRFC